MALVIVAQIAIQLAAPGGTSSWVTEGKLAINALGMLTVFAGAVLLIFGILRGLYAIVTRK